MQETVMIHVKTEMKTTFHTHQQTCLQYLVKDHQKISVLDMRREYLPVEEEQLSESSSRMCWQIMDSGSILLSSQSLKT